MKNNPSYYIIQAMGMHSSKYGGLEKFLVSLTRELNKHHITLIAIYNSTPSSKAFVNDLVDAGGKLVIAHAMKPVPYFLAFLKLFIQYKPILVHAHFQFYYSVFYAKILLCKNVFATLHGMTVDSKSVIINDVHQIRKPTKIARFLLHKFSDRIFAVSEAVRRQYISIFPAAKNKTEKFYLGVLPNNYIRETARKRLHPSESKILIGTIGFFSHIKGLDILTESLVILKDKYKCNDFIIYQIGIDPNDPLSLEFVEDCTQKGVSGSIVWMGIRNDVSMILPGLDIYCQPSRSEAISLSIMEAGMAGLPVIASRVGGIPEVVLDGVSGLLFDLGNAEQLALHIYTLISDRELRMQMGERSKEHMMANFNIHRQSKEMCEIYFNSIQK